MQEPMYVVWAAKFLLGIVSTLAICIMSCCYFWSLRNFGLQTLVATLGLGVLVAGCFMMPILAQIIVLLAAVGGVAAVGWAVIEMFHNLAGSSAHE